MAYNELVTMLQKKKIDVFISKCTEFLNENLPNSDI